MNLASSTRSMKIVLAGMVLAVASTVALSVDAQPMPSGGPAGHGMFMGGPHGGHMLERMLDSVNATDQQRAQIKQIMQSAHADLKAQHEADRGIHDQMVAAFTQPTVDANAVEALRQRQLAAHDQASKRMMQAMLDVSRVLTPEQRKTLADKMAKRHDMMQRHMRERQELDGTKPKG